MNDERPEGDRNGRRRSRPMVVEPDAESDDGPVSASPSDAAAGGPSDRTKGPTIKTASIFPRNVDPMLLPTPEVVDLVDRLEAAINMPVWLMIQSARTPWDVLDRDVPDGFLANLEHLAPGQEVALLVDSPGGDATAAYRLGRLLRRRCGGFVAYVPRYAKSAATLLCLGARQIVMGDYAELGPLDAQIMDLEREQPLSALDEVQALERLTVGSLESVDQLMMLLLGRTGKRVETLLPHAMRFVADTTRPLYDKVDTVHYTQTSRILKVAEQYAVRLLDPYHPTPIARSIAAHLVEHYPAHEFVIDRDEAESEGIQAAAPEPDVAQIFTELYPHLQSGLTLIGRLEEVTS